MQQGLIKLQILFVFLLAGLAGMPQDKKSFTLSGTITGKEEGYIYLQYPTADGKTKKDSALVQNGKFVFRGETTGPQLAYISGNSSIRSVEDPNFTSVFIDPSNMKAVLSYDDFKQVRLTGSPTHNEYSLLQAEKEKVQKRWKGVMDTLSAVNKRSNAEYQRLRSWVLKPYNEEMSEIEMDFIRTHPASYVTAYVLFSGRSVRDDSAKKIFAAFPEKIRKSYYGQMLTDRWDKKKLGVPGTMAANFTAKDINGNPLSLADFKGKYVLLDFWASWCVPCRQGNPHLLALYATYKDKGFEIIGISDDDTRPDAWRSAVEKDGIGVWKHVLRGLDMERVKNGDFKNHPNEISDSKYGITALPTKILIDPSGKIIGRYGGEGRQGEEVLDKKLAEIFK